MPRVLVLAAAVLFGTTGTAQALGPDASPLSVGAARIAVGAVLLALVARAVVPRARRDVRWDPRWVALAATGIAGYQLAFFAAVADTGVALGTVVALGSAPAFAGLGGWVIGYGNPGAPWAVATALAAIGVALLALGGDTAQVSGPGVALALVAGAGYALFTLSSKRLLDAGHAVEPVMAWSFALGAVLLIPVLAFGETAWIATPGGMALALFLGAVPTALAYLLFARGLRLLPASEVATLTLAEPVTAAALGALVLAERPGAVAVAGIALILVGLTLLALPRPARMTARARAA